jgi:hypothetical protein
MKSYITLLLTILLALGCNNEQPEQPKSASGVSKASVKIQTNERGLTVEQENIANRLTLDNTPGSIKHLYIMSAMTGDVLIYSTVKGKVTSSGKRLTPTSVSTMYNPNGTDWGIPVAIGGTWQHTSEVLQDDGSYGSSIEYLYWWDVQGRYHQHYPGAGQIIHISDQPLPIKHVKIRLDLEGDHAAPTQEEDPPPSPKK